MKDMGAGRGSRGAALVETLIVTPVLLLITLGAVQWALIYEARNTLNHAAFMAARAGATDHGSQTAIRLALGQGLLPLYAPDASAGSLAARAVEVGRDLALFTRIRILNPTREAFEDFGVDPDRSEIPNDRLYLAPTEPGPRSGLSVQDANLLKLEVLYGYPLKVPFVNKVVATVGAWVAPDPTHRAYLAAGRIPVLATAVVRMQTPMRRNGWVVSRAEVEARLDRALRNRRGPASGPGHRPWDSGPTGGG